MRRRSALVVLLASWNATAQTALTSLQQATLAMRAMRWKEARDLLRRERNLTAEGHYALALCAFQLRDARLALPHAIESLTASPQLSSNFVPAAKRIVHWASGVIGSSVAVARIEYVMSQANEPSLDLDQRAAREQQLKTDSELLRRAAPHVNRKSLANKVLNVANCRALDLCRSRLQMQKLRDDLFEEAKTDAPAADSAAANSPALLPIPDL